MKTYGDAARYFDLRRRYKTAAEIAEVINRSETYVRIRMNAGDKDFTAREKKILNIQEEPACFTE